MPISVDNQTSVTSFSIKDFINAVDLRQDQFGRVSITYDSTDSVDAFLIQDDGTLHTVADGESWDWPIVGHSTTAAPAQLFLLPVDFAGSNTAFDLLVDLVYNSVPGVDEEILYFLDY